MIVQRFVRWCEAAPGRQRAEGYTTLALAFLEGRLPENERDGALAALHMVPDDPSPLVRGTVAGLLATHPGAPRSLVNAFLADNDAIAEQAATSQVLTCDDLLRALGTARECVQVAIAGRSVVSAAVAAAIAWRCGVRACRRLLLNPRADLSAGALRRLSDRFSADPETRTLLAARPDLPADVRQVLVLETARTLQAAGFVRHAVGGARADLAVFQACERATTAIGEDVEPAGVPAFVEHLRVTGQMSPAFLIRSACTGNIDLLAAALTALSCLSERRVRAIVVEGRDGPFRSLLRDCGVGESAGLLIRTAVRTWKEAATRHGGGPSYDAPDAVIARIAAAFRAEARHASTGTTAMLRSREGEIVHDAMRARRRDLLAA